MSKWLSLFSISNELEIRRLICRGGIEEYCLANGIGNIPCLCYFFAIIFNMFHGWTGHPPPPPPPLPSSLRTMSQHFFIGVLAFSFETYSCQLSLLLARMTCLALALFIQYSCKFAFVGDLLKTLKRSLSF